MFHDAATPTALCSLDTPQAFPRTATDKDAEGLTGCTMARRLLTTARRRLTPQDAPCGARGAKGRQRRTDGIAAWRRHGGGASVSCLPTTPPCAGLGCELTSFEKVPSMPGRWPADACSPIDACPLCFLGCPRTATPAEPVRAPAPPAPTHTVHCSWTPRPHSLHAILHPLDPRSPHSRDDRHLLDPRPLPRRPPRPPTPDFLSLAPKCFLHSRISALTFLGFPSALCGNCARRSPKPCVSGRARAVFGAAPRPTAPFRSHDPIIFESSPFLT